MERLLLGVLGAWVIGIGVCLVRRRTTKPPPIGGYQGYKDYEDYYNHHYWRK